MDIVPPYEIWEYSQEDVKRRIGNMRKAMQKYGRNPNGIFIHPALFKLMGCPETLCGLKVMVEEGLNPNIAYWLSEDGGTYRWIVSEAGNRSIAGVTQ